MPTPARLHSFWTAPQRGSGAFFHDSSPWQPSTNSEHSRSIHTWPLHALIGSGRGATGATLPLPLPAYAADRVRFGAKVSRPELRRTASRRPPEAARRQVSPRPNHPPDLNPMSARLPVNVRRRRRAVAPSRKAPCDTSKRANALTPSCVVYRKPEHAGHHEEAGPGLRDGRDPCLLQSAWVDTSTDDRQPRVARIALGVEGRRWRTKPLPDDGVQERRDHR
jgi:hypothetical protein